MKRVIGKIRHATVRNVVRLSAEEMVMGQAPLPHTGYYA